MKTLPHKLILICLVLSVINLPLTSCRKVGGKVASTFFSKQTAQKVGKYAAGALFLVAVEELIVDDMLNLFEKEPDNKEAGAATIYNNYAENLTIQISNDGKYWQEKNIALDEPLTFSSTKKGLISIHSGDQGYFMLRPGKEYAVTKKDGKIVVEEIKKKEDS